MSATATPGFLQQSGEWLITQLKSLQAEAKARDAEISTNNGRIIALDQKANAMVASARKTAIKADIAKLVAKQVTLRAQWRSWWGTVSDTSKKAIAWLREHGYATTGLSGPELLPLAIVAGLVAGGALWVANKAIKANSANVASQVALKSKQLDEQAKLDDAVLAKQITPEQHAAMSNALADQAKAANDANPSNDPFGLASLVKPLVIVGALFILAPPLINSFSAARTGPRAQEA